MGTPSICFRLPMTHPIGFLLGIPDFRTEWVMAEIWVQEREWMLGTKKIEKASKKIYRHLNLT